MREKFANKLIPSKGTIIYDDWFQKRSNRNSQRTIRL